MQNSIKCLNCGTVNWGTAQNCIRCTHDLSLEFPDLSPEFPDPSFEKPKGRNVIAYGIIALLAFVVLTVGGRMVYTKLTDKLDPVAKVQLSHASYWDVPVPDEDLIRKLIEDDLKTTQVRDKVTAGRVAKISECKVITLEFHIEDPECSPYYDRVDEQNSVPEIIEKRTTKLNSFEVLKGKIDKFDYSRMKDLPSGLLPPPLVYYCAKLRLDVTNTVTKTQKGPGADATKNEIKSDNEIKEPILCLNWDKPSSQWFPRPLFDFERSSLGFD